jgi:hypothetical protein
MQAFSKIIYLNPKAFYLVYSNSKNPLSVNFWNGAGEIWKKKSVN